MIKNLLYSFSNKIIEFQILLCCYYDVCCTLPYRDSKSVSSLQPMTKEPFKSLSWDTSYNGNRISDKAVYNA